LGLCLSGACRTEAQEVEAEECAGCRGVPLFFGGSQSQACALVMCYRLVFVLRRFGHHGLVLDFRVSDSSVVGLALLALGRVVTDTQSLHGLEAQSSAGNPLCCHTCSQSIILLH
jgi:hypothetical protein